MNCYKNCGNTKESGGEDNICLNCGSSIISETEEFVNDLELLTKEEIIESLSYFYEIYNKQYKGSLDDNGYMVKEFGRVKKSVINMLRNIVKLKVENNR